MSVPGISGSIMWWGPRTSPSVESQTGSSGCDDYNSCKPSDPYIVSTSNPRRWSSKTMRTSNACWIIAVAAALLVCLSVTVNCADAQKGKYRTEKEFGAPLNSPVIRRRRMLRRSPGRGRNLKKLQRFNLRWCWRRRHFVLQETSTRTQRHPMCVCASG